MGIIEGSEKVQKSLENWSAGLGRGKYSRILKMARKPTREEYGKVLTITGLGILFIGGVGFTLYFIFQVWLQIP
jgi:protein transport protein SEC61 subunit gamma-like protein